MIVFILFWFMWCSWGNSPGISALLSDAWHHGYYTNCSGSSDGRRKCEYLTGSPVWFNNSIFCFCWNFSFVLVENKFCYLQEEKAKVIQTLLFVSGLNTLLQSLFGTRLPAVIGASYTFVAPTISIILSGRWSDPDPVSVWWS